MWLQEMPTMSPLHSQSGWLTFASCFISALLYCRDPGLANGLVLLSAHRFGSAAAPYALGTPTPATISEIAYDVLSLAISGFRNFRAL